APSSCFLAEFLDGQRECCWHSRNHLVVVHRRAVLPHPSAAYPVSLPAAPVLGHLFGNCSCSDPASRRDFPLAGASLGKLCLVAHARRPPDVWRPRGHRRSHACMADLAGTARIGHAYGPARPRQWRVDTAVVVLLLYWGGHASHWLHLACRVLRERL